MLFSNLTYPAGTVLSVSQGLNISCPPCLVEADAQSAAITSAEAAAQWCAQEVPIADEHLNAAVASIDSTIGFEDKKMSRSELKVRARHMIANGSSHDQIKSSAELHWEKIDDIRPGDALLRLCGDRWLLEGSNGRVYQTESSKLHVTSIGARGYVQASCPKKHEFGRVAVADYLFDIGDG